MARATRVEKDLASGIVRAGWPQCFRRRARSRRKEIHINNHDINQPSLRPTAYHPSIHKFFTIFGNDVTTSTFADCSISTFSFLYSHRPHFPVIRLLLRITLDLTRLHACTSLCKHARAHPHAISIIVHSESTTQHKCSTLPSSPRDLIPIGNTLRRSHRHPIVLCADRITNFANPAFSISLFFLPVAFLSLDCSFV